MAITTYDELQDAISDWLINDSLSGASVSHVTTCIELAEATIAQRLAQAVPFPPRPMETVENPVTIDEEYEAQPSGFIRAKTLEITGLTRQWRLKEVSNEQISLMKEDESGFYAARGNETGETTPPPEFYAVVGDEFRFFPVPQASFSLVVTHYKKFTPLSDAAPSNWVLASHPNLYLWGSIAAALTFIESEDRLAKFEALFGDAMQGLLDSYPKATSKARLQTDLPASTRGRIGTYS